MLSYNTLLALLDHLQDAVFVIENGRFLFVNDRTARLFGWAKHDLIDHPFQDFVYKDDRSLVLERYAARQRGEPTPDEYSFRIVSKDGDVRDVKMRVGTVLSEEGTVTSLGSLQDITEQQRTRLALQHTQEDIASILANMSDVFYRTDMRGIVTLMSASSCDTIGYSPEEMIGKPLSDFYFNPADRDKVVNAFIEAEGRSIQVESLLKHKDGSPVWVSTNAYIRYDSDNTPVCIEGIARDITERKQMEEQLAELVKYDHLTQLYNRRQFLHEGARQVEIAHRYNRSLSILVLDLDWFKRINDNHGHDIGDRALTHFARIFRETFRKSDILGRLGGEEFIALMPETQLCDARELAERLRSELLATPLKHEGKPIPLSFSAGLTSATESDSSIEEGIKRADGLLYRAKENGRDQVLQG
jgi:diguanylate cyclase (GGDEF)-like protein/PAS domain S-box-containing protein